MTQAERIARDALDKAIEDRLDELHAQWIQSSKRKQREALHAQAKALLDLQGDIIERLRFEG